MWSQVLGGISLGSICESVLPINLCTLTLPGTPLFQMLKGSINVHWKEVGQMSNTSPFLGSDWIFGMFCFDITIILILETCSVAWMTRLCLYYLFSCSICYMFFRPLSKEHSVRLTCGTLNHLPPGVTTRSSWYMALYDTKVSSIQAGKQITLRFVSLLSWLGFCWFSVV